MKTGNVKSQRAFIYNSNKIFMPHYEVQYVIGLPLCCAR